MPSASGATATTGCSTRPRRRAVGPTRPNCAESSIVDLAVAATANSTMNAASRPPRVTIPCVLFAHTGHVLTTIAYFVPVVLFLAWLVITQIKDRRSGG